MIGGIADAVGKLLRTVGAPLTGKAHANQATLATTARSIMLVLPKRGCSLGMARSFVRWAAVPIRPLDCGCAVSNSQSGCQTVAVDSGSMRFDATYNNRFYSAWHSLRLASTRTGQISKPPPSAARPSLRENGRLEIAGRHSRTAFLAGRVTRLRVGHLLVTAVARGWPSAHTRVHVAFIGGCYTAPMAPMPDTRNARTEA